MKNLQRVLIVTIALLLTVTFPVTAFAGETGELLIIDMKGQPVEADLVAETYGVALLRGFNVADGLARTGDMLADGRKLVIIGDVNGDGLVNEDDVALAARCIWEGGADGNIRWTAADWNMSGRVDISDVVQIQNMIPTLESR